MVPAGGDRIFFLTGTKNGDSERSRPPKNLSMRPGLSEGPQKASKRLAKDK